MFKPTTILQAIILLLLPASSISAPVYIEENNAGITIRISNTPLGEVLQSIEDQTGIQFHVSPSVLNDQITVDLKAPDWQTAMRLLLEPYGRAEVWSPRLDMTEIYILSRTDGVESFPSQPQQNPAPSESGVESPPMLSMQQFFKITSGSDREPLSPKLFDDPEIRSFLIQNAINSLEDMKDTQKVKNVRIEARIQMRRLLGAKQN